MYAKLDLIYLKVGPVDASRLSLFVAVAFVSASEEPYFVAALHLGRGLGQTEPVGQQKRELNHPDRAGCERSAPVNHVCSTDGRAV